MSKLLNACEPPYESNLERIISRRNSASSRSGLDELAKKALISPAGDGEAFYCPEPGAIAPVASTIPPLRLAAARTGKETTMTQLTRRSVMRASLGLLAAGTVARPYIGNTAA